MPHKSSVSARTLAGVVATALALLGPATADGTVVPMDLQTLSDHAGQVIVGRVTDVRSYRADDPPGIASQVTFEQVEYLKGAMRESASTFTLTVPGGTVGDTRVHVCCAASFSVGDKWVLFLLPTYRTFPVVGLYQGAFLILPDAQGVERVYRFRHGTARAVVAFDADGFAQVASGRSGAASALLQDRLIGESNVRVRPADETGQSADAMSLEDFLDRIRPVLAESRDHRLLQSAGRPVADRLRAKPLVPAPLERGDAASKPESQPMPRSCRDAKRPQDAPSVERRSHIRGGRHP
ncbi:MAG: hypothetical protein JSV19_12325 [Phycisphaerales bacterium]|nr:MAG: hypothetical protein JSV19_12325 [Phycisphaerales bacterium]